MVARRHNQPIADEAPWSDSITPYDEGHLVVYLRLLDASADGASKDEMAQIVLGIDPAAARRARRRQPPTPRPLDEPGWLSPAAPRLTPLHTPDITPRPP